MRKSDNVVLINDDLAEIINLFENKKFNKNANFNYVDCSINVPSIVISNFEDVLEVVKGNDFMTPVFNNFIENEKRMCSYYTKDIHALERNRFISEMINFYNYDLSNQIETFVSNSFNKIIKLLKQQYESVMNNKYNLDQIQIISLKYKVSIKDIKWLFKKVKKINPQDIAYSIVNLDDSKHKKSPCLRLFIEDEDFNDVIKLAVKLLNINLFDAINSYEYFGNIFNKIQDDFIALKKSKELTNELIIIYISYYKLLAIRCFEFFDILKDVSYDEMSIEKQSFLMSKIEKEIELLEKML